MKWTVKRNNARSVLEWAPWFAWYPVTALDGNVYWLTQVFRKMKLYSTWETFEWKYSPKPLLLSEAEQAILARQRR